jgi:hypothetical protein
VGLSYIVYNRPNFRIMPVVEFLGWTALSGQELTAEGNVDKARGDTILNAKFGVRFGFGELSGAGVLSNSDLYVGYGHALTGDVWYKDIVRVEFRLFF